jgi:hypothetical protein
MGHVPTDMGQPSPSGGGLEVTPVSQGGLGAELGRAPGASSWWLALGRRYGGGRPVTHRLTGSRPGAMPARWRLVVALRSPPMLNGTRPGTRMSSSQCRRHRSQGCADSPAEVSPHSLPRRLGRPLELETGRDSRGSNTGIERRPVTGEGPSLPDLREEPATTRILYGLDKAAGRTNPARGPPAQVGISA